MEHLTKSVSAVRKGKIEELFRLIEQGVEKISTLLTYLDDDTDTDMDDFVRINYEKITKSLLDASADIILKNNFSPTPLNYGLNEHRLKLGEILMGAGVDVHKMEKSQVLRWAAYMGDISLIENLLKNISRSSWNEITIDNQPLMHLVLECKLQLQQSPSAAVEAIQKFVKLDFNINKMDNDGSTIFYKLLFKINDVEYLAVLICLLENGADPNAYSYGSTPLHGLLHREENWKIRYEKLKLLAKYKANFSARNRNGHTPLHLATLFGEYLIIRFLIEQGVDINEKNKHGASAVDIACGNRSMSVLRLLLDNGANIDWLQAFKKFYNARRLVEDPQHKRDLMFLIEHIDVNAVASDGKSLLSSLSSEDDTRSLVVQYIAWVDALDHPINQAVYDEINATSYLKELFTNCQKELALAKKTRMTETSWVTYFHLMTCTKRQLKNFAGNFKENFLTNQLEDIEIFFPIYGLGIKEKVRYGIEIRIFFDKATKALSRQIPIFTADSLIIQETIDCLNM